MFILRNALAHILTLLLPAIVFVAAILYYLNAQEQKNVELTLSKTATSTIAALDRELQGEISVLVTLAAASALDDGNLSNFLDLARRVVPHHEGWLSVVISDERRLLASTLSGVLDPPRPLIEPENATNAFRSACPCVSGVYPANERTGEPYYVISVPVVRDGAVKYTASAVVRSWNLHQLLSQLPVPDGGRIGFLDRDGEILARSNSIDRNDRLIGKLPSQSVLDGARGKALFQAIPIDGDPVYIVPKQHEFSGWTALISAPVAVLDAPRQWMLALAGGGAGAALLLTIMVGMAMARSTARLMEAQRRVADLEIEAEKRKGEKQFRTLADSIPQLAWMAEPDGRIFWFNKRWYDYTGKTLEDMQGGGCHAVLHPDHVDRVLEEMRGNWRAGTAWEGNHLLRSADGEWRWFLTRAEPIRNETGQLVRWFGTNTDITEQRRAEATLQAAKEEAERTNLTKSKFLAAASHDIRQPVQSLFFMLSALEGRVAPEAERTLAHANEALVALKSLLDGLLDISQLDAGTFKLSIQEFPLSTLLDQIDAEYRPLAEAKGLHWRVINTTAMVRSDPALLGRMLRNLCQNALKFTEAGGVLMRCRPLGAVMHIEVEDTGIGIAADKQDSIFEEFYQLANEHRDRKLGLGLGLAIVLRLSKLLGHPVIVRSAPGRGSTFDVAVPMTAAPVARRREAETIPMVHGNGEFVVVIDDEDLVRLGVRTLIESWGYDVFDAASGPQAREGLRASPTAPQLIVSDYRLPEGKNGIEAIRDIRTLFGTAIPAILLTGETTRECIEAALVEDISVLHKPVSPSQLHAALSVKLAKAGGA